MMFAVFSRFFGFVQKIKLRFIKNELHYVNGSDMLPPPLTQEEEEILVSDIEREDARDILIEHNLRLVAYIAKRFENTGANIEELISIGTVGLIKAISSFNAEKNIRLATYASRCIENEILMFIRKSSSQRRAFSYKHQYLVLYASRRIGRKSYVFLRVKA